LSDWSDEETEEPLIADHRNFYKVEKWTKDGQRVVEMVFAGSSLDKAKRIFDRMVKHRPHIRLTIRQRARVLEQWPPQGKAPALGRAEAEIHATSPDAQGAGAIRLYDPKGGDGLRQQVQRIVIRKSKKPPERPLVASVVRLQSTGVRGPSWSLDAGHGSRRMLVARHALRRWRASHEHADHTSKLGEISRGILTHRY
jgi:hypothetical protein